MQLRDEFWDTAPHYGGRKGIVPLISTFILLVIYFVRLVVIKSSSKMHVMIKLAQESVSPILCEGM